MTTIEGESMATAISLVKVTQVRDAVGALCLDCETWITGCGWWGWRTSQWLHRAGTRHKRYQLYGWR